MLESINNMLFNENFIPHGHCYLWQRELVGLHLLSDLLIALAYYSIPALLVYFVYKRRDVPFSWIFLLFGAFIISCGTTHIMEVWTLWHPAYWLSGTIKAITAAISLYTAAELIPLMPKALALPSPAQLEAANRALTAEIAERERVEVALYRANIELESRVEARTAELRQSNNLLLNEIASRKQVEESLQDALQKLTFHFENTPLAVVEWDSTFHRVCRWSPAAEKIFGWTAQEVMNLQGSDWNFVFTPDAEAVSKTTARLREGAESRNISSNRNYRKDGAIVYCEWYNSALYDDAGSLVSVLSLVLDVTERYSFLEALRQSEARFRIAAECASDLIYEWDLNTGIVLWFGHIDEALGYVKAEFPRTREGWLNAIYPDDRDRLCVAAEQHLQTHEPFFVEYRIQQQDGTFLYWIDRGTAVRDDTGKAYKWIGVTSDISDAYAELRLRKQAEEGANFLAEAIAVLASSLDYETTLQRLADLAVPQLADWCCVHLVEPEGAIRLVAVAHSDAQKVELMWEIEKGQPIDPQGRHGVAKVLRTGESKVYANIPDAVLEAVAPNEAALSLLREYDLLSAMCVPLIAHGRKLGVISLLCGESGRRYGRTELDLAERLAHHAAIAIDNARLYWEAQEANRIKDEFLATLSHELRTPLNAILGWSQILQQKKLTQEKMAIALETIERNARLQVQMIEDLLDVSRILAGKISLKLGPVELVGIIEAGLNTLRPIAEAKGVQLLSFYDERVGLVFADTNRLQQVIWNLLSNALKFTPNGGQVEVRLGLGMGDWREGGDGKEKEDEEMEKAGNLVTIQTQNRDREAYPKGLALEVQPSNLKTQNFLSSSIISYAEIQITDTGIGISQKFLPHVFERFRQADSTTTRSYGGLGLGLAIVQHIVTIHGGTVHAESAGEGMGATFTIRLPLLERSR
ncbi:MULTISPECIES: PAS domain-containing protein [Kamptonema]|uniref:sensor histidine kinase n=1 Tax=Kamptonema TaxID=1501433 RepID=UPI0001DAD36C|nr:MULTISPECIES: PAS domain-containing protein [Kamptonema]CBN56527.1 putative Sensor protein [Kamptonema sp. PCC 6506]